MQLIAVSKKNRPTEHIRDSVADHIQARLIGKIYQIYRSVTILPPSIFLYKKEIPRQQVHRPQSPKLLRVVLDRREYSEEEIEHITKGRDEKLDSQTIIATDSFQKYIN